ncbi:ribose transport protein RbsD [Paenibacillus sp. yr247]|uniref:D-ribose pyranase n=1 Tax=Paenibacillus sp. yr247 TaxID=1761880 RepID=UPI00088A7990|nr:D-ribose pyranase [Paenibacillus sp. yr247]SDO19142.1 ribose transport protein RbsD [Paenibacillus sp. yr247]
MKKMGIINSEIAKVIAAMGHTDTLVIVDSGYPIPPNVHRIDLSLRSGFPSILDVLQEVEKELAVEKLTCAAESAHYCSSLIEEAVAMFPGASSESVPHAEFKDRARFAAAIIRTGECTAYSNIILQAGVTFPL